MARNSTTATPYIDKQFSQHGCWRTTGDMWAAKLHAIIATATAHVADGSFHFLESVVDTPTPLRDLSEHCQQPHIYTHGMTKTCSCKQSAKRWLPLIGRLATNIKENRDMAQRSSRATRCPHCVHGDISVSFVFWRTPLRCARRARRCCTELPAATPQHCQQMCHAAFGHETCFCSIWHREHSTLSTTGDVTTTTTLSVVPRASNTNQSMHHVRETPLQRKLLTERGSDNCQRRRPPQTIARESK